LQVAQQLADLGWVADLVICSDSMRTRQTLEAMQEARVGLEVGAVKFPLSRHTTSSDSALFSQSSRAPAGALESVTIGACYLPCWLQSAKVHLRGDLYTIAALDGQTRSHLQVQYPDPKLTYGNIGISMLDPCQRSCRSVCKSSTTQCDALCSFRASLKRRRQGLRPGAYLQWDITRAGVKQLPASRWDLVSEISFMFRHSLAMC
jgi:hypothetical protein